MPVRKNCTPTKLRSSQKKNAKGRQREVAKIRRADRASAVGRLMLGKTRSWQEFLEADSIDLEKLPRRKLKGGYADIKARVSKEIEKFCRENFQGMTERTLSDLYEEIKAHRGLEIPLQEFENRYARIRPKALRDAPRHSTIALSLWGLQFRFPEYDLSNDVKESVDLAVTCADGLKRYRRMSHSKVRSEKDEISFLHRRMLYASRTCILSCFSLVEAYLNGLAWEFVQDEIKLERFSKRKRKMICDSGRTSLTDKIKYYPEIISGTSLWVKGDDALETFLDILKPFRDSLVHPSPFSVPERFGGYDKLKNLYRINEILAFATVAIVRDLLARVHHHVNGTGTDTPIWMDNLECEFEYNSNIPDEIVQDGTGMSILKRGKS